MNKKISINEKEPKEGYLRVSRILSCLNDFSGIDTAVLENKKNIGTDLHKAIELDIEGLCWPMQANAQGYFNSYRKWLDVTGFVLDRGEIRLYDEELKITGCLDAIGGSPHAKNRTLIDFKTSASANLEYWLHQGMFYHHLAKINEIHLADRFLFVQLCEYGSTPRVHSFNVSEATWRQCLKYYYSYICDKNR